ncbi:MAG: EAL domain-containing protein [candidate division Zixibacteria bacterium]|nr:EAL domain-containing protein [candidate division Zixibacteria bacterium]
MPEAIVDILLIEDNPGDTRLIEEMLAESPEVNSGTFTYELTFAETLEEGLRLLEKNPIDIVLLDLSLPDSRGLATIIKVKEKAPDVPIVALTGLDDHILAVKALQKGAQDYLVKGQVDSALLIRSMRYAIERELMTKDLERARKLERHLAYHDTLTNLPNRSLFYDRLNQAISFAKRSNNRVAVLFLDLDGFKRINDSLGHSKGDILLQIFAQRLKSTIRESDTIARLGGDEFTIILENVHSGKDAAMVAEKILKVLADPISVSGFEVHVSASIGISLYPNDARDIESLVKNADLAMYRAKNRGKNNYQLYNLSMDARASERLEIENSLRRGIENNEFHIHYQPQVHLLTGELTGAEALVRWRHPKLGLVYPDSFIHIAEETGLIIPLGQWVINEVCRQNVQWQESGIPPLRVSVNLSPRQFADKGLVETIYGILNKTGLNPLTLELEITEGSAMEDVDYTALTLQALKKMGVRISVDDFGTGYSSMGYLKKFPIDKLKIDQSFLRNVPDDQENVAITTAIVALAHSMGLKVVAEGVENVHQERFLKNIKCDEMQGFHYCRPLALGRFKDVIKNRNRTRISNSLQL